MTGPDSTIRTDEGNPNYSSDSDKKKQINKETKYLPQLNKYPNDRSAMYIEKTYQEFLAFC
jgi:hypothetical protein